MDQPPLSDHGLSQVAPCEARRTPPQCLVVVHRSEPAGRTALSRRYPYHNQPCQSDVFEAGVDRYPDLLFHVLGHERLICVHQVLGAVLAGHLAEQVVAQVAWDQVGQQAEGRHPVQVPEEHVGGDAGQFDSGVGRVFVLDQGSVAFPEGPGFCTVGRVQDEVESDLRRGSTDTFYSQRCNQTVSGALVLWQIHVARVQLQGGQVLFCTGASAGMGSAASGGTPVSSIQGFSGMPSTAATDQIWSAGTLRTALVLNS